MATTTPHERPLAPMSLDDAPCGYVAFTDDGVIRATNATLLAMLGRDGEVLVGRKVDELFNVGTRIFFQTHLFPLLRMRGHAEEIFVLLRTADGTEEGALLNAVRRERNGHVVSDCVLLPVRERRKFEDALVKARDDAEAARVEADRQRAELRVANARLQEQAEELEVQGEELQALNDELLERSHALERQREIAEEANHAKSAFLAAMSHELRTPLNAIGGYVQLLEMGVHGPVTPQQVETFGKVLRSQRHLLRLINEVLNLARIEAGTVTYDLRAVPLAELVNAVLPMVEPQIAARGLRCKVLVPDGVTAHADRDKAEQVLLNLLSNAVKFTPEGGSITITGGPDADTGRVWLDVSDTGVGIPDDRQKEVFDPFVQVDVSPARRAEGTGLGLAISRDLARGMGGDLTLASVVSRGSRFRFVLAGAVASSVVG